MRKLSIFLLGLLFSFAFAVCGWGGVTVQADSRSVYIGGMSAGFTLQAGNPQIVGLCEVVTEEGVYSPALDEKGNSLAGKKLLELLSKKESWSVF